MVLGKWKLSWNWELRCLKQQEELILHISSQECAKKISSLSNEVGNLVPVGTAKSEVLTAFLAWAFAGKVS